MGGDVNGPSDNCTVNAVDGVPVDISGIAVGAILRAADDGDDGEVITPLDPPDGPALLIYDPDEGAEPAWSQGPHLPIPVRFSSFRGHQEHGLVLGSGSVSVAGTGADTLQTVDLSDAVVRLTGALSGDRTLSFPAGGGRVHHLINATTGGHLLRLQGPSGGFCYLLPGQGKTLFVDNAGVLRGEALAVLEVSRTISLVGLAGGDTLTTYRLPPRTVLERCELLLVEAVADGDGEYSVSAGFGSYLGESYADVLAFAGLPSGVRGLSDDDWGDAFEDGYSYSNDARSLVVRLNAFNQTVTPTAGTLRVHLVARYLGE